MPNVNREPASLRDQLLGLVPLKIYGHRVTLSRWEGPAIASPAKLPLAEIIMGKFLGEQPGQLLSDAIATSDVGGRTGRYRGPRVRGPGRRGAWG